MPPSSLRSRTLRAPIVGFLLSRFPSLSLSLALSLLSLCALFLYRTLLLSLMPHRNSAVISVAPSRLLRFLRRTELPRTRVCPCACVRARVPPPLCGLVCTFSCVYTRASKEIVVLASYTTCTELRRAAIRSNIKKRKRMKKKGIRRRHIFATTREQIYRVCAHVREFADRTCAPRAHSRSTWCLSIPR